MRENENDLLRQSLSAFIGKKKIKKISRHILPKTYWTLHSYTLKYNWVFI